MNKILQMLNQESGVRGSMLVTPDGLVVAAELQSEFAEELLAAIVSSIILLTKRALSGIVRADDWIEFGIEAVDGRIAIVGVGSMYLVVFCDADSDTDANRISIQSALNKIQSRRGA
jgi:hypothetical protein